ncbi:YheC/YheD family protein [Evansella sp. AB-rgal1]|uniref:YheC/YheD family protein n=1 Tax=Evansella sp. AB-rgal1 TaxID=3242696 RepID=UPI00359D536A
MANHRIIRSKMQKTRVLENDPILTHYVPDICWFSEKSLLLMLRKHQAVYIKPDKGRQGLGIWRIVTEDTFSYTISNGTDIKTTSKKNLYDELTKILHPKKKYLIQKGIDLATYRNRPFDIRMVMQKIGSRWTFTLSSAKVGDHSSSIVTYSPEGSLEIPLEKLLVSIDQEMNLLSVYRELIDVSHQIATRLGQQFPFQVLGLDMAIDKDGSIWFIEANTKPDCTGLKKLNDPISLKKFRTAKAIFEKENNSFLTLD